MVDKDLINRVLPITIRSELYVKVPNGDLSAISNPFSTYVYDAAIDLWRNCGDDNICQSKLTLRAKSSMKSGKDKEELQALVINDSNVVEIDSTLAVQPELSYGYVL